MLKHILILSLVINANCLSIFSQTKFASLEGDSDFQIPGELNPFVKSGTKAIAYAEADLNGDKATDYIIVLQEISKFPEQQYFDMSDRPTLIIVRDADGKLSVAARNEKVVLCINCIGGMSDPLREIAVKNGGFSITHRGGNRELWIQTIEFEYSRHDKIWLLKRVIEKNYDGIKRKTTSKQIYSSPEHFGKVKFADFDPDNFKGKGGKAALQKKASAGAKVRI